MGCCCCHSEKKNCEKLLEYDALKTANVITSTPKESETSSTAISDLSFAPPPTNSIPSVTTIAVEKLKDDKHLYDEDIKLRALLQSESSNINYTFIPNGLLTFPQFLEFIRIFQVSKYDEHVLKACFRYLYTNELPSILPPSPMEAQEEEVNVMYVSYSEVIGCEYDEMLNIIKANSGTFYELMRSMIQEQLQQIYTTLGYGVSSFGQSPDSKGMNINMMANSFSNDQGLEADNSELMTPFSPLSESETLYENHNDSISW